MLTKVITEDIQAIISEFDKELHTLEGKTVLITGGNGLIPSYLVDVFASFSQKLDKPIKLIVMNRNPITEKSRLGHLIENKNVVFITQDVGKPFDVLGNPEWVPSNYPRQKKRNNIITK